MGKKNKMMVVMAMVMVLVVVMVNCGMAVLAVKTVMTP